MGPDGEVTIDNGKIEGNKFSFTVNVHNMTIPHSGTFYGDSVGLNVELDGNMLHATPKRDN